MDLLIFTCEDREHLLARTWESFRPCFPRDDHRVILAIDGEVVPQIIDAVAPDLIIRQRPRRGYVSSIINALKLIETETFFWLEDDWQLRQPFEAIKLSSLLLDHPQWLQIRLSITAPLGAADHPLAAGVNLSSVGFSANPSICRTSDVRRAFDHVRSVPRGERNEDSFENIIGRWIGERGLIPTVLDPGQAPAVTHLGELQSTGRAWHMTRSLDRTPTGHGYIGVCPPRCRRLWMLQKLFRAVVRVGARQLFNDADYDLAFRFMAAAKSRRGKSS